MKKMTNEERECYEAEVQKILAEIEQRPNAKCNTCGKELDFNESPGWIETCDDCKKKKLEAEQSNIIIPKYDIDAILEFEDDFDKVEALRGKLDYRGDKEIPWSSLLPAEIACRAFQEFDTSMGNGFEYLSEYCGGPETFIRGYLALKQVGSTERLKICQRAKEIFEEAGLVFPDVIPQDWWSKDHGVSFEIQEQVEGPLAPLTSEYWNCGENGHQTIVSYLRKNIEDLRTRKKI